MMGQKQKAMEDILNYLKGKKKIVLMGCGGCATIFHTGGIKEVEVMAEKLSKEGKEILTKVGLPFGTFCCYLPMSSGYLKAHQKEIEECDAMLMQSCGDGLQAVRGYLEEELGIVKPMYPANDALGFVGEGPSKFVEKCQGCGDCILADTVGICPWTQCPKGLLNGPCGGVQTDGKCEVDSEKDCAWVLIYKRLEKINELDKLSRMMEPKDWSKMTRPRKLEVEPLDLMEKLRELKKVLEEMKV